MENFKTALTIAEKTAELNDDFAAQCMTSLAGLLDRRNEYGEAEFYLRRVIDIYEKKCGPDHPKTATSISNLAELLDNKGDLALNRCTGKRSRFGKTCMAQIIRKPPRRCTIWRCCEKT
ncbi:tetratricopeptide repeat protein [candidate division KSB1 bacterium]|nr:tetratricopeptide repeat protein [candidate division KSB1 bacterium]